MSRFYVLILCKSVIFKIFIFKHKLFKQVYESIFNKEKKYTKKKQIMIKSLVWERMCILRNQDKIVLLIIKLASRVKEKKE